MNRLPLIGGWLFSRYVGRVAPYSGSIFARVEKLEEGFARVSMQDRKCLRNPFQSIHAIALANLGELATGLAFLTTIPSQKRGIVTSLKIDFFKKARGKISCECHTLFPQGSTCEVAADLLNEESEKVACVTVTWALSENAGVS